MNNNDVKIVKNYIGQKYLLSDVGTHNYYVAETNQETIDSIKEDATIIHSMPIGHDKIDKIDIFELAYGIKPMQIVGMGDRKVSSKLLNSIIPYDKKDGYKCYQRKNPTGLVKIHEDSQSSWNCIMELMGNPEHIIMFKVKMR